MTTKFHSKFLPILFAIVASQILPACVHRTEPSAQDELLIKAAEEVGKLD